MSTAMPMLKKAVADLCTNFSGDTIRLADLGCSSGPNTLVIVTFLVESFIEKLRQLGRRAPEFQVFLNDLPINDFNTLFLSLPPFYERLRGEKNMVGEEQGSCFVAGVPGSFYSKLFPSRSLHLIHSSYSVHWLSQVLCGNCFASQHKLLLTLLIFDFALIYEGSSTASKHGHLTSKQGEHLHGKNQPSFCICILP